MISMKVALISVINPASPRDAILPPLGLAYIASYLQKHSSSVKVRVFINSNDIIGRLQGWKPDIVGISSVTQNFNLAINLGKEIKSRFNVPIIVGGHHITALPHTLPDCFDI